MGSSFYFEIIKTVSEPLQLKLIDYPLISNSTISTIYKQSSSHQYPAVYFLQQ